MQINNEFTVSVPIQQAWDVMLDLERIAPCLPGAAIQGSEGDEYQGTMKVKIGPITASYKGTAKFEETNEENLRAVLNATGRDARGQGTASATITSNLEKAGDRTKVSVETDMKLTGRAAPIRAGRRTGRGNQDARAVRRMPRAGARRGRGTGRERGG